MVQDRHNPSGNSDMALRPSWFKSVAVAAIAALLLGAALGPALPVAAASPHQQFRQDQNGNATPFYLDQDPCAPHPGRRARQQDGQQICDTPPSGRGNSGVHHPGSSAFGLQFNSGDD